MSRSGIPRLAALAVVLVTSVTAAGAELVDPYEILEAHYDAVGGLERLKAQESLHFVADISTAGLSGTLEHWEIRPDRSREVLDLGVLLYSAGDNGATAWALDTNGKLRIERDPYALARREGERRLALFEHLDPASSTFTIRLVGTRDIEGDLCYVLRIDNSIDNAMRLWFISTSSFLMRRSELNHPDAQQHIVYSDYREVDGVIRPFRQDVVIRPAGEEQTILTTSFEVGVEIDPRLFDPPEGGARDYIFLDGGDRAVVPFQFIENHIFATISIDGKESMWVVDSGASVSVIDSGYAADLGLPLSGEMLAESATEAVQLAFTTLPPFRVGGIEVEEQQVAALDFVGLFRRISDLEVLGILGYDFLSRFVTRVDYANETLTLFDPESFEYTGHGTVLDAPLVDNTFRAEATVDGVHTGLWMLDLGAGGLYFHTRYAQVSGLGRSDGVLGVMSGAGGRALRRYSRYGTIEFGGHTVEEPVIASANCKMDAGGELREGELAGNLGNSLFRHFVLYLDYDRQQVIVEKGENFGKDFPVDMSGLQLWRPEEACEVLYVSPGTPAEEAGFREGDIVVSIDGTGVDRFGGLVALHALLIEEPGTEHAFVVDRDGETVALRLVLRDLFESSD
ncbi:MAG: aspartyl protease family protein [Candidatus Krumholzibacteriota bacterium]|nr:aspartyl protease family protein [Candidatus Krumholzibacteriota bacterium]